MSRLSAAVMAGVVSLLACTATGAPAQAKVDEGPRGEAFYTPPQALAGKAHGDPIWARRLTGAAVVPGASSTRVLLYRSQDAAGQDVAVSGVVSIPKGKRPRGGWPVVTYAHGTTGIADQCAPSRDVPNSPAHPYNAYILPVLAAWLKAGYAVVRTDYQGLGTPGVHQYLIGRSEGRAVLDMALAARRADPRLGKATIIAGHSQGGHAALFAAALAPAYAPRLSVRGTVAFAPASHLDEQIPLTAALAAPGSGLSALVVTITRGIDAATPGFDAAKVLSEAALAHYPHTLTDCLGELAAPSSVGGLAPQALFRPGLDFAPIAKLLDAQDPSHLKIKTPVLIEQGAADTTVIPLFTDRLATELKDNGASVSYDKVAGVGHGDVAAATEKDVTAWMAKRLRRPARAARPDR
jgi:predicted esterase